MITDQ